MKNAHSEARAAFDARSEVEVELGALKENHSKMVVQLKEAVRARDSAEAGLKTTERQFEDIRKQLHYTEINMATKSNWLRNFAKNFKKPGRPPNYLKRQLRPRSKPLTHLGWRRLRPGLQRNSPLWLRTTAISLGVKPLMLLGFLLTLV